MVTLINHQGLKVLRGIQIQTPSPPLGLAYIGGFLKTKGIDYFAIDGCGENLEKINKYKYHEDIAIQGLSEYEIIDKIPENSTIIGFTCNFSHCWPLVLDLAIKARSRFPHAILVVGGEHATALPEGAFSNGLFDVVVYGEGEETLYELITKIHSDLDWHNIDGIIYLNNNGELITNCSRKRILAIDNFPYPDWDNWSITDYIEHNQVTGIKLGRSIPILGSRGCPYACTFCSNEGMWGRRYIMRSGKSIVDEMEYLINKYNVNGFTFMDLTFIINRSKVLSFANELINRKLNINYQLPAGTRCEAIDIELCKTLEKSGLKNFALAPESGSPKILRTIKKQISLPGFYNAVRTILQTKITVGCFVVIGFPEDTKESLKQTLKLIRKLAVMGIHDITVSKFIPYPGTHYYNNLLKKKIISNNSSKRDSMINFFDFHGRSVCKNISDKSLSRLMRWYFINFYIISIVLRPWRFLKNLVDFFRTGVENTRYMRFISEMLVVRKKWKKADSRLEDN